MEFGKVSIEELEQIKFELPVEPSSNSKVLASGNGNTRFYLGYATIREKLNIYARTYNSIELNTTYYTIPTQKQVDIWGLAVPEEFKFAPKLPQVITHLKRLKGVQEDLEVFLKSIQGLSSRIGGLILMPHPQLKLSDRDTIENFIRNVPSI